MSNKDHQEFSLDDILNEFHVDPAPAKAPNKKPAARQAPSKFDTLTRLDLLLGDDSKEPEAKAAPAPKKAPARPVPAQKSAPQQDTAKFDTLARLDLLLSDDSKKPETNAAPAPKKAPAKPIGAKKPASEQDPSKFDTLTRLNLLLGDEAPQEEVKVETAEATVEEPVAAAPAAQPTAQQDPSRFDTLTRLDALLFSEDKKQPEPKAEPAPEAAPAVSADPLSDLDTLLGEFYDEVSAKNAETVSTEETIRFDPAVLAEGTPSTDTPVDPALAEGDTIRMDAIVSDLSSQEPAPKATASIIYNPRTRLRELKKKLVAGPEKRYYELSEQGIGKVQVAMLVSVIIVILCALTTTMFTMGLVPENRLRFLIFTQVLGMLVCALMGANQMIDGLGELFRGRFSVNTLLSVTFVACCVDAVLCFIELRVPCCAAFSLEMAMALWARYQRYSTETAQMDTMRKAVRLNSLVKVDNYFGGKPGILRGLGEVEDFMDNYHIPSTPERVQGIVALISMLACFGIAAFAGLSHDMSLAIQVLSTSLLVAVPASSFIAVTRPMAILERRLHMVGTVLCGWRGVKGLSGKAAFPVDDRDLFPNGSSKLNGVKFYGNRNPDEVVSYAASLMGVAGGGLVPLFDNLRKNRNCTEYPVMNFRNYGDGGVGGEVQGEPVLLGNLDFLQDMGVEIPAGTMVNQAVYAAVDGQLCAVFAISYAKMRSSSAGLISLCGNRKLTPVIVSSDFMLTESLIQDKFGVNTRRVAFPTPDVRAILTQYQAGPEDTALALATRDDLVSLTYAVSGARSLRTATNLGVGLNIFGGILGMVIMLVLAYLGRADLLTPTNVLLYQLVWMLPSFLITEWTRTV